MPRPHYHVFVGMSGYLPDNEPETYTTLKDARDALRWHADGYRDFIAETPDDEESWRIRGSLRGGWYAIERGDSALDINLTIDPCTDPACLEETAR